MSMFRLLLLCCIMSLHSARAAELCSSLGGNNGSCIQLTKCEPVMNLLRNNPLRRETSLLLNDLTCGFKRLVPLICCMPELNLTMLAPTTTTTTTTITTTTTTTTTTIPSPSVEYPNWDLLPHESCGYTTTPYVVGGKQTDWGELPWLALISHVHTNGNKTFGCGGVLINKRYVLTAAHCVHNATLKKYTPEMVRLGEHDIDVDPECRENPNLQQKYCADPVQDIPIEDIIIYSKYKGTSTNRHHDIALIRLQQDATLNRYVVPICLPTPDTYHEMMKPGTQLTLAGWGLTETGQASKVKMKAEIQVVSLEDCRQSYNDTKFRIIPQQICGGSKVQDSCDGDSGGPLMDIARSKMYPRLRYFVVGVVSYGPKNCGDGSRPAVYTRVVSYLKWILNNLQP